MQELGILIEKAETGFYWKRWYLEKDSVGDWLVLNGIFSFYCSVMLVFSLDYL